MYRPDAVADLSDRFVLEQEAGSGGMGVVYRAHDRESGATVALKILRGTDRAAVRRFGVEAAALGKLDHPAVVRYLAHGRSDDEAWLAMEWIEGESLADCLSRSDAPLAVDSVIRLGQRLAGALAAAHALGIVHRDVKPSNVLLPGGRLDEAKLADFGVARAADATTATTTTSGTLLGTVGYIAPEQARGERDVDGRADLFSLGCVLFRCLTGKAPYEGGAAVEVLAKLLLEEPPRVQELRRDVPEALDDLIARLLAKETGDRPASAARVGEELATIAAEPADATSTATRPRVSLSPEVNARTMGAAKKWSRIPIAAAVVSALAVVAGAALLRGAPRPETVLPPAPPPPTIMTDRRASDSCTAAAKELYEQGLADLHGADYAVAHSKFEKAAEADPSCPEIPLRLLITGYSQYSMRQQREMLRRTIALRSRLDERDQRVLDSFAAVLEGEAPDYPRSARILDEAVARFPNDAELLFLSSFRKLDLASNRDELEAMLDRARRATFLDPSYADAWQLQARILGHLGLYDDELAALDRCSEAAPGSGDCIEERIDTLRRTGRCGEAVAEARQRAAAPGAWSYSYWLLANALASVRAAHDEVDGVLRARWDLLPPGEREWAPPYDGARLAAWEGDFEKALSALDELQRMAATLGNTGAHFLHARIAIDVLRELGRGAVAARVANHYRTRARGWVPQDWLRQTGDTQYEPMFLAAQLDAGEMTPAQWRTATDAWDRAHRDDISDFERWVLRWGTAVGAKIGAAEAMQHTPPAHARKSATTSLVSPAWIGMLEAYEGRLRLYAGDAAAAVPLLETASRSCNSLQSPVLNVQSHFWLGQAKERLGDVTGACKAYGFVIDRWGRSKLPSVTAKEAKERSRTLACRN